MNRSFYFMALMLAFALGASAQTADEQKKLINSIKKDKAYLYAEITTPDQQKAKDLAEDMLNQEINKYVAEQKKLRQAANIVTRNTRSAWEEISLPRGNCYRAFLYVKKSDIIPADNVAVTANPAPEAKPDAAEVKAAVVEPIYSERKQQTINQLLATRKFAELQTLLPKLKKEGKVAEYAKQKDLKDPAAYVFVVFNREGVVEAVLSEGQSRINLGTKQPDSLDNYEGRGMMGVRVND
jgi:hypothetical protein